MPDLELTWEGDQVKAIIEAASVDGLEHAAEHLLQVSRTRVPIEEGTLERSGVASVDRGSKQAAVSYDTPYAVRQHDDLTLRHDAGRTAKYLEGPMHEEQDTMLAILAKSARESLGG